MYKLAINRPITVIMGMLIFIIFGLISYKTMPVSLFPNIDFPLVVIQTKYPDASGAIIETKVTDKLEEALSGIDGIDKITSSTYDGRSIITVQFLLEKNLDSAINDIRDKLGGIRLPSEVSTPIIFKGGASSTVLSLFISTKSGNIQELMSTVSQKIKPGIQKIKDVAEVTFYGQKREIKVLLEPKKLNQYQITSKELESIIARENINKGIGKISNNEQELYIKAKADALSVEDIKNINVRNGIKLSDVANVVDDLSDASSYSTYNGQIGVLLRVKKISGTNTLDIINNIKNELPDISNIVGKNYTIKVLRDSSPNIQASLDNVLFDLLFGSTLAVLVVFLFLRNISATMISALAIPISVIGTFAIIHWLGYGLNKLTMLGLVLAIGIFIDDAIVVIENITKKLEKKMAPFMASFEGIKEIAFSILAISAVLLAVFIPVAFMSGIVGLFFNSFALTVASGVVISFIVSMTFVPSLSARLLSEKESWFFRVSEPFFVGLENIYIKILRFSIRFKFITIAFVIALVYLSFSLKVGMNFVPKEDSSKFRVTLRADPGTSLVKMKEKAQVLLDTLKQDKNIEYTTLSIGGGRTGSSNVAKIFVKLVSIKQRKGITQIALIKKYQKIFSKIKDSFVRVSHISNFGGNTSPIQVVLKGSDFDELELTASKTEDILKGIKGVVRIDNNYEKNNPQINIKILRQKAAQAGVRANDIVELLASTYSSSQAVSYFAQDGKEYAITLRYSDKYRENIQDINNIQIKNKRGDFILLGNLITISKKFESISINRFDRQRSILVRANVDGVDLGSVAKVLNEKLPKIMPSGYSYKLIGEIENLKNTQAAFIGAISLALILIYLILAALYESFIQPLMIMVSMPLSITGVLVALYYTHQSFNLFVMIGLILLIGMVGKNAILVVDFANKAIKDGMGIDDAIAKAGQKRLRPILMTSIAMIGAMLPTALSTGIGHETNSPMATAIIGGLTSSTILTLLVIPSIYKIMYPLDRWLRKWYEKELV